MEYTDHIDYQYQKLVEEIIDRGYTISDRTGTGTKKIFAKEIRWNMSEKFPLLTTKEMHWSSIVSELIWFLKGETNIRYLLEQNNTIWLGDCYKNYLKNFYNHCPQDIPLTKEAFVTKILKNDDFAKSYGGLGQIYGYQWRKWNGYGDQIKDLIIGLKKNPYGRRHIVTAWNPSDVPYSVLPPCHYGFECFVRPLDFDEKLKILKSKKINYPSYIESHEESCDKLLTSLGLSKFGLSLVWNQRSVDTGLGLPFNIASYALLLELLAKVTNMVPDMLVGRLTDTHLYLNHIEPIQEQLKREPLELPTVSINFDPSNDPYLQNISVENISLNNYVSHKKIKLPLSN